MTEKLEKDLSGRPEEQKLIHRLREKVERLTPDEKEIMAPDDKEKFPGLSSRQENLKERTNRLKERLEMLAQLFPGMDTEILNDLKEAAGSMGKASGKLKGEDAPGAIPPEQEAIHEAEQVPAGDATDGPADGHADAGSPLGLSLCLRPKAGMVLWSLGSHAHSSATGVSAAQGEGLYGDRSRRV